MTSFSGSDRHPAAQRNGLFGVLEAGHSGVGQNAFGPVGGRLPEGDRGKRLAAAGDDRVRTRAVIAERCFDEAVAIEHRHADVVAVGPAFLQSPLGNGMRHVERQRLFGDDLLGDSRRGRKQDGKRKKMR